MPLLLDARKYEAKITKNQKAGEQVASIRCASESDTLDSVTMQQTIIRAETVQAMLDVVVNSMLRISGTLKLQIETVSEIRNHFRIL